MLRHGFLCLSIATLAACPSSTPNQDRPPKADAAEAAEAGPTQGDQAASDSPEADAGAPQAKVEQDSADASADTGSAPAIAVTTLGSDTEAAKLNPEGCTKPGEGSPTAYRLTASGANGAASVNLRLDIKSAIMIGEGFRMDAAGLTPETVHHQIEATKVPLFTAKLDALCLNFAPVSPELVAIPDGYTRYGVEFGDGSVRWMSDSNPGLAATEVFGKVERDKWLDLNSSWPKYQDATPVAP